MKEIERMIFILLWIICTACNSGKPSAEFDRLEQLMPHHPDSVLQALESMDTLHLSEREQAYYYLLQTEAEDKCYVEHTTDSLISWAGDYFRRKDDRVHYAKALYLQGRIYEDWQRVDRADSCWFRALDAGKECSDFSTMFLLTSSVGLVYAHQRMLDEAFDFCQQSLYYAELSEDSSSISYAHIYIARVYGLQEKWTEALAEYEAALNIALESHQTDAQHTAIQELMGICTRQQLYLKADSLLSLLQNDSSFIQDGSFHLVVGNYYRHKEDTAKAIPHLKEASRKGNLYTIASASLCLSYLYKDCRCPDLAMYYDSLYHASADSIDLQKQSVRIKNVETDFQQTQMTRRMNSRTLLFIVVVISILFISGITVYLNRKRNRMEIRSSKDTQEQLRKALDEKVRQIAEIETQIQEISSRAKGELDSVRNEKQELVQDKEKLILAIEQIWKDSIGKEMLHKISASEQLLESLQSHTRTQSLQKPEMELLVFASNYKHHCFALRLKYQYPLLTNDDLYLCCLIRLGFTKNVENAKYFQTGADAIKKRKQRIKTKLGLFDMNQSGELELFINNQ